MLGTLGFLITDIGIKLPGDIHNVPSTEAHNVAVQSGAMAQILTTVAVLEFVSIVAIKQMLDNSGRAPGEYGFDVSSLLYITFKKRRKKRIINLKTIIYHAFIHSHWVS